MATLQDAIATLRFTVDNLTELLKHLDPGSPEAEEIDLLVKEARLSLTHLDP